MLLVASPLLFFAPTPFVLISAALPALLLGATLLLRLTAVGSASASAFHDGTMALGTEIVTQVGVISLGGI